MLAIFRSREQREKREWEEGRQAALEIVRLWASDDWTDEDIREKVRKSRISHQGGKLTPYVKGYQVGWQEAGITDARRGSVHARQYRSHWYNMGWWNEMLERRKWGWRHERLDLHFERMRTLYWDRLQIDGGDSFFEEPS